MTKEKAELVLAKLKGYERLERKATDETGWIAFMFSVERDEAEKMIRQARLKESTIG